jgi:hypothetical protein
MSERRPTSITAQDGDGCGQATAGAIAHNGNASWIDTKFFSMGSKPN